MRRISKSLCGVAHAVAWRAPRPSARPSSATSAASPRSDLAHEVTRGGNRLRTRHGNSARRLIAPLQEARPRARSARPRAARSRRVRAGARCPRCLVAPEQHGDPGAVHETQAGQSKYELRGCGARSRALDGRFELLDAWIRRARPRRVISAAPEGSRLVSTLSSAALVHALPSDPHYRGVVVVILGGEVMREPLHAARRSAEMLARRRAREAAPARRRASRRGAPRGRR